MTQNDLHRSRAHELVRTLVSCDARLFGGAAFAVKGFWNEVFGISRPIKDIDLVVASGSLIKAMRAIRGSGGQFYLGSALLNDGRLVKGIYEGLKIDIYTDPLYLNQYIELGQRLTIVMETLTPADLLATKFQIEHRTEKDVRDVIALLAMCPISHVDEPGSLNIERIIQLCGERWNFYYACHRFMSDVTECLNQFDIDPGVQKKVADGVAAITRFINQPSKSWYWNLRSRIGPRLTWYFEIQDGYR